MNDSNLDDDELGADYIGSPSPIRLQLPERSAPMRLDSALAASLPQHSRTRLARWIAAGRVTVDGATTCSTHKVMGGECIEVWPEADPTETAFAPEPLDLSVHFADPHIIVIDKPPGLVVHPAAGNWSGTLLNGLLHHFPELAGVPRAGIVHRLDKDTSGLMVVARTVEAQTALVRQLQARSMGRTYLALACGKLDNPRRIDAPIGRHPKDRLRMAVVERGKPAITHVTPLRELTQFTWVQCKLETGRTHQIRVHMAHVGHPLAADPVYGRSSRVWPQVRVDALEHFNRRALRASALTLIHPARGEAMTWQSPVPPDLTTLISTLEANP